MRALLLQRKINLLSNISNITSTMVQNLSNVVGANVTDALDNLLSAILGLDTSNITNASTVPGATASDALDTLLSNSLLPEIVPVHSISDLPTPIGNIITLDDNKMYMPLGFINITPNVLVVSNECSLLGTGAFQSGFITSNTSPLISGRRLLIQDLALINSTGPCISLQGTAPADINSSLRGVGCVFSGNSISGVIQINDSVFFTFRECTWINNTGVGIYLIGTISSGHVSECFIRANAAGFTWLQIPGGGAATITQKILIHGNGFDLANGGIGVDADPTSLTEDALHMEINVFPDPSTPGVGSPIIGITSNDPECHFAGNLNLENTHVRGALTIENNAIATTITNTLDYFKLACVTILSVFCLFDSPANVILRVLASVSTRVRLTAFVTLTTAVNNQNLEILFAVTPNGIGAPTLITAFIQEGLTGGASGLRINALPLMAIITLNQNDWVDVRVRNTTAANNVTWHHGQFFAEEIND